MAVMVQIVQLTMLDNLQHQGVRQLRASLSIHLRARTLKLQTASSKLSAATLLLVSLEHLGNVRYLGTLGPVRCSQRVLVANGQVCCTLPQRRARAHLLLYPEATGLVWDLLLQVISSILFLWLHNQRMFTVAEICHRYYSYSWLVDYPIRTKPANAVQFCSRHDSIVCHAFDCFDRSDEDV